MKSILTFVCALLVASLPGCKSSDKKAGESEAPGLSMSSNSAACKKAMACCAIYAKNDKGTATPEDLNLKCSGVAMAKSDTECDQFRQGYAASFDAKGTPAPAECK